MSLFEGIMLVAFLSFIIYLLVEKINDLKEKLLAENQEIGYLHQQIYTRDQYIASCIIPDEDAHGANLEFIAQLQIQGAELYSKTIDLENRVDEIEGEKEELIETILLLGDSKVVLLPGAPIEDTASKERITELEAESKNLMAKLTASEEKVAELKAELTASEKKVAEFEAEKKVQDEKEDLKKNSDSEMGSTPPGSPASSGGANSADEKSSVEITSASQSTSDGGWENVASKKTKSWAKVAQAKEGEPKSFNIPAPVTHVVTLKETSVSDEEKPSDSPLNFEEGSRLLVKFIDKDICNGDHTDNPSFWDPIIDASAHLLKSGKHENVDKGELDPYQHMRAITITNGGKYLVHGKCLWYQIGNKEFDKAVQTIERFYNHNSKTGETTYPFEGKGQEVLDVLLNLNNRGAFEEIYSSA